MSMFVKLRALCNRKTQPARQAHNPRESWPAWTDEVAYSVTRRQFPTHLTPHTFLPSVPKPWHCLLETQRDYILGRPEGKGQLLARTIEQCQKIYAKDMADAAELEQSASDFTKAAGDRVIWDGLRVVAVLRARVDGYYDVTRFDDGRHRIYKQTDRWAFPITGGSKQVIVEVRTFAPGQCVSGENDEFEVTSHGPHMVAVRVIE